MWRPLFLGPGARFSFVLKLVRLYLPPERSGIAPHPRALCLWKPSSFLGRQAEREEEVWTMEMMSLIGRKTAWFEQAEAWV